jgi:dipeptidyl aminopeptidase/acylaminoacyl peptidase
VVGESARADVVDVWLNPATNAPEAYAANYLRRDWRALDPDAQADLDYLDAQLTGDFTVVSRSNDDARWIVVEDSPTTPTRSYLYDRTDREHRRLTLLFRQRPALESAPLQPMTPVEIEARDGLTLVSYLTLPIGSDANGDGRPDHPTPLVIAPHSEAWGRAAFGFDPFAQWLANRGYAVLSVNSRGSTGFGKAFLNAGNREWGGRMQEDLLDALAWAVTNGVAQRDRVALVGAGYGGFAALTGLASTPDQFRCGVSFAGPASLASMLESTPAYYTSYRDQLYLRIGDPRTPEGRQALRDHSPLTRAGQITRPLLLAIGAHDPRTPRGDIDQVAQILRGRLPSLVYLVYPEEGHELVRPQNRLSFFAVMEHFLGSCLGGRIEPVGTAFDGANLQAFDGASTVPGLSAFVRRAPAPPAAAPVEPTEGAGGPETEAAPPENATPSAAVAAPPPSPQPLQPTP